MPHKWEDHVTMTKDTGGKGEGDHQGEQQMQHGQHQDGELLSILFFLYKISFHS